MSYELEHYGVKGMKWDQSKLKGTTKKTESLKGKSFFDTKVYQTNQWLKDNGYKSPVDVALNAVKSIIPKRRSSGDDLAKAMQRVNAQGKTFIKNMSSKTISVGTEIITKYLKKK